MKKKVKESRKYLEKQKSITTKEVIAKFLDMSRHKEQIIFEADRQRYYIPLEYLQSITHLPDYPAIYDYLTKELREKNKPYVKANFRIKYLDEM